MRQGEGEFRMLRADYGRRKLWGSDSVGADDGWILAPKFPNTKPTGTQQTGRAAELGPARTVLAVRATRPSGLAPDRRALKEIEEGTERASKTHVGPLEASSYLAHPHGAGSFPACTVRISPQTKPRRPAKKNY